MYKLFFLLTFAFSVILLTGCNKNLGMMSQPEMEDYVSVNPRDGETAIRLDKTIELVFYKPVDKSIVERDFHVISYKDMADSTCPFGNGMNHTDMNMAMMDSMKMNHLFMQHHTKGTFTWVNDSKCLFKPDSLLAPNMPYMISMGSSMMGMMMDRMGNNMNMKNMGSMKNNMMMMHFVTMDTASGGGGHLGHH